jgi:hypothetical protein
MLNISEFRSFFLNKSHFTKVVSRKNEVHSHSKFDTLFWCFYILKHGYDKYEIILQTLSIIVEKQMKIEYIQKIRLNKSMLNINACKSKPFSYYEDQLANMEHIDLYTFFLLCHLENVNILYIVNNCFYSTYEINGPYIDIYNNNKSTILEEPATTTTTTHIPNIISEDSDTDESELSDIDEESTNQIPVLTKELSGKYYIKYTKSSSIKWNTLCKIYKLHQPIPPISSFTLSTLQQLYSKIYKKLPSNQKKQDIYNEIQLLLKLI